MNQLIQQGCEQLGGIVITCVVEHCEPWFKAVEVAKALKYKDTDNAVRKHVSDDFKRTQGSLISKSSQLKGNWKNTMFINGLGVQQLVAKSNRPEALVISEKTGIKLETRYIRKETEIIGFIQEFLTTLNISFEFQKSVLSYKIDLYLPEQRIAIEIDEFGHKDRNPDYENERENQIANKLHCKFLRFNPDAPSFKISNCIAIVTHNIFRS